VTDEDSLATNDDEDGVGFVTEADKGNLLPFAVSSRSVDSSAFTADNADLSEVPSCVLIVDSVAGLFVDSVAGLFVDSVARLFVDSVAGLLNSSAPVIFDSSGCTDANLLGDDV